MEKWITEREERLRRSEAEQANKRGEATPGAEAGSRREGVCKRWRVGVSEVTVWEAQKEGVGAGTNLAVRRHYYVWKAG